ncbi:trypsin-like peptidase domain-containing protein [Streptomyces avermitilis]|uniref:trypsin-like peptidase domain-containing protein n=1 Tax=Streptomyces avermitilis TaxID=33903 RepID=UPI00372321DE
MRFCDLAGRPRGTGFAADHHGTVLTSHEAVDGLSRLILHAPGERTCVVTADAVTPLPDLGLAIVRTEGLALEPLPVIVRERIEVGTYVRIVAGGWREARVLGTAAVTYTATDRCHLVDDALELAIGTAGVDALRLGGGAAGGPVLDAETGAVVAVLGTALHTEHRAAGFAVPLRGAGCTAGPLGELLTRNAATVPAYRADLNPAGVLELAATTVGSNGPSRAHVALAPVERACIVGEFAAFADGPATVLGLVGVPGSGRTTELASLAARRDRGPEPAPTLWLRGADLLATDTSVADAAARALERAARIVAAADSVDGVDGGARHADGVGCSVTSVRSGWPVSRGKRGARCCSCWTGPRRCRRSSRTGCPSGPPGRPRGCGRRGCGSSSRAGPSTGSRPGRDSRGRCCTAPRGRRRTAVDGCRPACGWVTWRTRRRGESDSGTRSPRAYWRTPTHGIH